MADEKPQAVTGEYMGSPTITIFINNNANYRFTFGYGKAKAILEYLADIKKFVEDHEKDKQETGEK